MIIKILIYLFFAFVIIFVFREKHKFIYFIPLFNVLTDVTFNYFDAFSFPTILRAVVLTLFLFLFWDQIIKMDVLKTLYFFFFYILIIMLFSKELMASLKAVAQVILSMSMFFAGYKYITNYSRYRKLLENLSWVILVGFVAVALGYIFGIGKVLEYTATSEYGDEPEYVGLLGSGGLYGPALALSLLPFIVQNKQRSMPPWLLWVISAGLYIFIILNVRRTVIIIPVVGVLSYMIFSKRETKVFKYVLFFAFTMLLFMPVYRPLLEKRIEARAEEGRFEKGFLKTESRYKENLELFRKIRTFDEPVTIIFGIGNNIFAEHIQNGKIVRRMYHSDTAKLLYGTGLVGLVLYICVYIQLLHIIIKIPNIRKLREYKTGALTLWFISVFVSFNGSISLVTFRAMSFLMLGAFLGMANAVNRKSHGTVLIAKEKRQPRQ